MHRSDVDGIVQLIETSGRLVEDLNEAVDQGRISHFAVQPESTFAGGTYSAADARIAIPLASLRPTTWSAGADLMFVLGHEVQHATNSNWTASAWEQFRRRVRGVAARAEDYDGPINDVIASARVDEDSANIAGWNVFVEHCSATRQPLGPGVDQVDRANVVARYERRSDVTFNDGFDVDALPMLTMSRRNVTTMSRFLSGAPAGVTRIGRNGRSDYPNYYGAIAVSTVAYEHRAAWSRVARGCVEHGRPEPTERPIPLRLGTHGLRRELLEDNGLHLGYADDLAYLDLSTFPPTRGVFHHTSDERAPTRASMAAPTGRAAAARGADIGTEAGAHDSGRPFRSRGARGPAVSRTAATDAGQDAQRATSRGARPGRPGHHSGGVDRRPGSGVGR